MQLSYDFYFAHMEPLNQLVGLHCDNILQPQPIIHAFFRGVKHSQGLKDNRQSSP